MARSSIALVLAGAILAACGSSAADAVAPVTALGPAEVARAYLEAGARGDEARVRELLDPQCHSDGALLRVDAVRVLGAPMTLSRTTVTASDVTMTSANVAYVVEGSVRSEGGTTEILGATVETGRVDMDGVTQSGTLRLAAHDGPWRVVCAAYAITPYG